MYSGPLIFSQVMDFLPPRAFQRCVERYQGDFSVKRFSCLDQFRAMAFAQLTYRESLRDIGVCLRAQGGKLYHIGIRGKAHEVNILDELLPEAGAIYVMDRGHLDFPRFTT